MNSYAGPGSTRLKIPRPRNSLVEIRQYFELRVMKSISIQTHGCWEPFTVTLQEPEGQPSTISLNATGSRRADGNQMKSNKVKAEIKYTEKIMSRKFNKAEKPLFFKD